MTEIDIEISNFPSDIEQFLTVSNKAFGTTDPLDEWFDVDEMINEISKNRGICLKAKLNDNIVGVIYAQQENPINGKEGKEKWSIILMAVDPEYQRRGIGKKLLESLERVARNNNIKKIFVFTNHEDKEVIQFYEKNGYSNVGTLQHYQYGTNNHAIFLLKII